jgi:hypothetical protein
MKKFLGLLSGLLLVLAVAGSASALSYSITVDLSGYGWGNDLITWSHEAPADFEVPFDIINSASITISYKYIDTSIGEDVWLDDTFIGTLGTGSISPDYWDSVTFDVSAELYPFANGSLLNFALQVNETKDGHWRDYWFGKSTFDLDYDNGSAPVPEPATMLLFGIGLLGLVGLSRRKK